MELHKRSGIKSAVWRLLGIVILAAVTYFYTQSFIVTGLVTLIHNIAFLFIFYGHERLWLKFKLPKSLLRRSVLKMLTYETLLGNVILGLITFIITGDFKQMTQITITYIGIKHIVYIIHEFYWKRRVKWGIN